MSEALTFVLGGLVEESWLVIQILVDFLNRPRNRSILYPRFSGNAEEIERYSVREGVTDRSKGPETQRYQMPP